MSYKHETRLHVQSELARRGWSKAAQVIIEFFDALENSDEYKATQARIADLEARLATAEAEVVRLRDEAEDLRFHLGCESVTKDGYLTECEAASAVIADLRAKYEAAEAKAKISQITAETEKRLRESSELEAERECLWSSDGFNDLWESSCGMAWTFPDEGPKENDMTYCPKCRGVLVVESND